LTILIEKCQRRLEKDRKYRVTRGIKKDRFFEDWNWSDQWGPQRTGEPRRRMVQHSIDWEPGIRQNPRNADQSGSGNLDRRANCPDVLHNEGGSLRRPEQTKEHVMMVGSWPCKVSSEIHINGRCVSEPVHEDKGRTTAPELEDRRDPKRARVYC
jgi:hypothetical protein